MQVGRQGVTLAERRMAILTGRIVFVTLAVWTLVGGSGGGSRASADPSPSIVRYVVYSLPLTLGVRLLFDLQPSANANRSAWSGSLCALRIACDDRNGGQ